MKNILLFLMLSFALFSVTLVSCKSSTAPPIIADTGQELVQSSYGELVIVNLKNEIVSIRVENLILLLLFNAFVLGLFTEWLVLLLPFKLPKLIMQVIPIILGPIVTLLIWILKLGRVHEFNLLPILLYGLLFGIVSNAIYDTGIIKSITSVFTKTDASKKVQRE